MDNQYNYNTPNDQFQNQAKENTIPSQISLILIITKAKEYVKRKGDLFMDNQYNYNTPNDQFQNQATGNGGPDFHFGQTDPDFSHRKKEMKPRDHKKVAKIAGGLCFAVAFGVIASAAFQTTNFVGNALFGEKVKTEKSSEKKVDSTSLTRTSSTVTSDVIASAAFQTTNFVGNALFGEKVKTEKSSEKKVDSTSLTRTSSTVTSDVSEVVNSVMPSVVSITNMSVQQVQSFFGGTSSQEVQSSGSGIIVGQNDTELLIATNNSVVSITNMSVQQVQSFFGGTSSQEVQSSGSGIIVGQNDTELLIATNNHVVEGSTTLTVSFINESSAEAKIKGTDASRDLAVIAVPLENIEEETMGEIKVATLGDSTKLQVGEPVIAIGNALGYGQSVTTGIVSALNRQIDMEGFDAELIQTDAAINPGNSGGALVNANGEVIGITTGIVSALNRQIDMEGFDAELIQTDAAINPGNSGGALVNANGEVIGINTVKVSSDAVEGMGYAIPISDANETITTLMNKETREQVPEDERGFLGVEITNVEAESAELYGMPTGVYIRNVIEGTGAEKAGLVRGGVITELDGSSVDSMTTLQNLLSYYRVGETVTLTVEMPGKDGSYEEKEVEVVLSEKQTETAIPKR